MFGAPGGGGENMAKVAKLQPKREGKAGLWDFIMDPEGPPGLMNLNIS